MSQTHGYSGTPLVRKLGLRAGMAVRLYDPPDDYWTLVGVGPGPLGVELLGAGDGEEADFTHLFATDPETLAASFHRARGGMREDGMVWASWPKRSSGVPTRIGRAEVMAAGKDAGLVDIKVCAIDETWSALKFVIPVSARGTGG